jgi:hypothetical protein
MSRRALLIASVAVVTALGIAGASLALALAPNNGSSAATRNGGMMGYGNGMMTGYGDQMPMMGGAWRGGSPRTSVSGSDIVRTQERVARWLAGAGFEGFRVAEVMAFSNNDYVAVYDARGVPAFELLVGAGQAWVMEEPPSMMWNTRYGMMRGSNGAWSRTGMMGPMMGGGMMSGDSGDWDGWCAGYGAGGGQGRAVSAAEAISIADRYLARARPGERAEHEAQRFPGYFTIDTTREGKIAGMVSVNASTGAVWYHGWHGSFLKEREF